MTKQEYTRKRILCLMAEIEEVTGIMFHEAYPEEERLFWAAAEAGNRNKLLVLQNKLANELDRLTSDCPL